MDNFNNGMTLFQPKFAIKPRLPNRFCKLNKQKTENCLHESKCGQQSAGKSF